MFDLETALERAIPELNLLTLATPDITPGALLESRKVDRCVGRIESFLVPPLELGDFETERHPAAIDLRQLQAQRSGSAALGLLHVFGLDLVGLNASTARAISIQFQIEAMTVQQFKPMLSKFRLERALRSLEKRDSRSFRLLKGHFLVTSAYYASNFRLTFHRELLDAIDLDSKLEVAARAQVERVDNTVWIAQNNTLPFGVFGYDITRGRTVLE